MGLIYSIFGYTIYFTNPFLSTPNGQGDRSLPPIQFLYSFVHMKKTYFTNDEFAFLDRVKIKTFLKNEIGLLPTPPPPLPHHPHQGG